MENDTLLSEINLEIRKVQSAMRVDQKVIPQELEARQDTLNAFVEGCMFRLIMSLPELALSKETVRYPATWWDAFKKRFMPWRPYHEKVVELDARVLFFRCPHVIPTNRWGPSPFVYRTDRLETRNGD